jgi:hypothetical protein
MFEEVIENGVDFGMGQCDLDQYEEEIKLMRLNMEVSLFEN